MPSTLEATPKPTILVVDDSPDMLRYLRMVLELITGAGEQPSC